MYYLHHRESIYLFRYTSSTTYIPIHSVTSDVSHTKGHNVKARGNMERFKGANFTRS